MHCKKVCKKGQSHYLFFLWFKYSYVTYVKHGILTCCVSRLMTVCCWALCSICATFWWICHLQNSPALWTAFCSNRVCTTHLPVVGWKRKIHWASPICVQFRKFDPSKQCHMLGFLYTCIFLAKYMFLYRT